MHVVHDDARALVQLSPTPVDIDRDAQVIREQETDTIQWGIGLLRRIDDRVERQSSPSSWCAVLQDRVIDVISMAVVSVRPMAGVDALPMAAVIAMMKSVLCDLAQACASTAGPSFPCVPCYDDLDVVLTVAFMQAVLKATLSRC